LPLIRQLEGNTNGNIELENYKEFRRRDKRVRITEPVIKAELPIFIRAFGSGNVYQTSISIRAFDQRDNLVDALILHHIIPAEYIVSNRFTPAKIRIATQKEKVTKISQITGRSYSTTKQSSYVLPFGCPPNSFMPYAQIANALFNSAKQKNPNNQITFTGEKFK